MAYVCHEQIFLLICYGRQAQELGLHRLPQDIVPTEHDRDTDLMSPYDLEQNKKAFNILFTYDRYAYFDQVSALLNLTQHRVFLTRPTKTDA